MTKVLLKIAAWIVGILAVIVTVLEIWFIDRIVVGHNVMAPTIVAGDQVVMWLERTVDMGSIVVCPHPRIPGQLIMGRIVAKPGMTIETVRGQLRVENTIPNRDLTKRVRFTDVDGTQAEYQMGIE